MSKILSPSALKGLNKIGDIMVPKNGEFPAFSEVGGLEYIDDLVAYAPEGDISDLGMVLSILSFMPTFVLQWLVNKLEDAQNSDGFLSPIFRQLDFALRGLIFSCYYTEKVGSNYTGKKPLDIISWEIKRVE